jgi:hypothetical protein
MNATFSHYPKIFPIQSFFDNAALSQALLVQSRGNGVVVADKQPNVKGSFVGLSPDSQTPVAFRPLSVDKTVGAQTIILVPGQVIRIAVNGFEWGLPYGWLGGGLANLIVANNEDPFINWPQVKTEVLLHRFRAQIQADGASAGLTYTASMPNRFPWPSAQRSGTTATSQAGQPIIAPELTRVALRLRVNNLAATADMRIVFKATDDFDTGSDGLTPGTADFSYVNVTFPQADPGALSLSFPVVEANLPARLGGDVSTIALVDLTGASALLASKFVDILRYGKI